MRASIFSARTFFALSLSAMAVLATACNDDPAQPELSITLDGVEVNALNFDTVNVGASKVMTLKMTNKGGSAIVLDGAQFKSSTQDHQAFSLAPLDAALGLTPCLELDSDVEIAAGKSCGLAIEFKPTSDHSYAARVTSATSADPISISLIGQGHQPKPKLIITPGAAAATEGKVTPFDFGEVAILSSKVQAFTLTNTGDMQAELGDLSSLALAAPFAITTPSNLGGLALCQTDATLAPQAACVFGVKFEPEQEQSYSDAIEVDYTDSTEDSNDFELKLTVTGKGKLDCSATPELSASRAEGVQAAIDQMVLDAIQGTADGEALTYDDGHTDGYAAGYNTGYQQGYNGPEGYPKGYDDGYPLGHTAGATDTASCNQGKADAIAQGTADGTNDGSFDGYDDGYDDGFAFGGTTGYNDGDYDGYYDGRAAGITQGYNDGISEGASDGYDVGYDVGEPLGRGDGYAAGVASCEDDGSFAWAGGSKGSASAPKAPKKSGGSKFNPPQGPAPTANPADYVTACYDQGYKATYSTSAYWDAYNAAKAANEDYQNGYTLGVNEGKPVGLAAGKIAGYNAGKTAGYSAGFADGSSEYYQQCYDTRYPSAYSDAYASAYSSSYQSGSTQGVLDAYDVAYDNGYNHGYTIGFNETYNGSYNSQYGNAYLAGYNQGFDDGYDYGYSDGYADGRWNTCFKFAMFTSAPSGKAVRIKNGIKAPTPVIPDAPAASASGKLKTVRKPAVPLKEARSLRVRAYGQGQTWWKVDDSGRGASTFVPSARVPEELKPMRELKPGSYRSFLRGRARSKPLKGLGIARQAGGARKATLK